MSCFWFFLLRRFTWEFLPFNDFLKPVEFLKFASATLSCANAKTFLLYWFIRGMQNMWNCLWNTSMKNRFFMFSFANMHKIFMWSGPSLFPRICNKKNSRCAKDMYLPMKHKYENYVFCVVVRTRAWKSKCPFRQVFFLIWAPRQFWRQILKLLFLRFLVRHSASKKGLDL